MSFEDVWELPWSTLRQDEVATAAHALAELGGMTVTVGRDNAAFSQPLTDDTCADEEGHLQLVFEFNRSDVFSVVDKLDPSRDEEENADLQQELDELNERDDDDASDTFAIAIDFWEAEDDDRPRMELYSNHFDNRDIWNAAHTLFRTLGSRLGAEPREEVNELELAADLAPRVEQALADLGQRHELPLLPVRNRILFPYSIRPCDVGRAESVAAIDSALNSSPAIVAVLVQREPSKENPELEDLYALGCAAEIVQVEKYAEDNYNVVLIGVSRIRVKNILDAGRHRTVVFETIDEVSATPGKGLLRRILRGPSASNGDTVGLVDELRTIMKELDAAMEFFPAENLAFDQISEPGQLADLCANQLNDWDNDAEVQAVLETTDVDARLRQVLRLARDRRARRAQTT
jgi:Lon protease-like protein